VATSAEPIQARAFPAASGPITGHWAKLAVILIVGYQAMGKSFAYLGLPGISVYIGEVALAAFLLFGPRARQGQWFCVVRRVRQLKRFEWLLLLSLFYGGFEALRGILKGYPALAAVRDIAFNYYPLFLFLGIWVGLRDRGFCSRAVRMLALWGGCYGLAWVLFLSRIPWTVPGTGSRVPLFLGPYGASTVALLGLLAFEAQPRKVWHLILLNAFALLGTTSRADWVALTVGVLALAWLAKRFKYLAIGSMLMIVLLGLMYVTGLSLPSPMRRGENAGNRISADYLVARAIAPISKDAAEQLAPATGVSFAAGTAQWRLVWWANIWQEVHTRFSSALLGFGYGYPIGELNPDIEPGAFIQTPHNDILYALAFSGWLGVTLFALLQAELFRLLWRSFGITGQPFGLVCWAALLTMSLFEDFFEAPFGAIPFFLLVGAAIAPALLAPRRASPHYAGAPLLGSADAQLA